MIQRVRSPPSAPNCNAQLERLNGSFKREAADPVIFFGDYRLRRAVDEYLDRKHRERNQQGFDLKIIEHGSGIGRTNGKFRQRDRLDGKFDYNYRDAA